MSEAEAASPLPKVSAAVEVNSKLPLKTLPSMVSSFSTRSALHVFKFDALTPPFLSKERILGPWTNEELNDEQRDYNAIRVGAWPPPHVMHFGFVYDKPFSTLVARARAKCSKMEHWELLLSMEEDMPEMFKSGCMDILSELVFRRSGCPCIYLSTASRAGMPAAVDDGDGDDEMVGLLTMFSNDLNQKYVEPTPRVLRVIRRLFKLPADAQPAWYYDKYYQMEV